MTKIFELTAHGRYYKVFNDGEFISNHYTEREAIENAQEQKFLTPKNRVYYTHQYEVEVGLIASGVVVGGGAANSPPEWTSIPNIVAVEGVAKQYDLNDYVIDPDGDALTWAWDATSTALPAAVSVAASTGIVTITDQILEQSLSSVRYTADDGVNLAVASSNATIQVAAPPPPGGVRKWHPGHYLKVQGKPSQTDSQAYIDGVISDLNTYANDDVLILGGHVGFGWGVLNPTGNTYNWDHVNTVLDWCVANGKYLIAQIQSKNFSLNKSLEAPADIIAQVIQTNTGWTAALWRDGTVGFPDVMGRYITFWQAFITQFNDHPNMEIFVPTESSPSLGIFAPADFSTGQYGTQLRRMYSALAPLSTKTNIAANINNLGTGGSDEVPSLIELAWQSGMIHATPDAKVTVGYNAFKGTQTYTVPVTRDYSAQPMGCLEVYSNDVATQGGGKTPAQTIDAEQAHGTTHLSWISPNTISSTWTSIKAAINADPLLTTTTPANY